MTPTIKTLGELKKSGYISKSIKDELRDNLIHKIKNKESVFTGILGYEDTVIPEIERAILSRHNMNLLGLRGQAKTRIARQIVELLDEYTPIIAGSELNDDPLNPISNSTKQLNDQTLTNYYISENKPGPEIVKYLKFTSLILQAKFMGQYS